MSEQEIAGIIVMGPGKERCGPDEDGEKEHLGFGRGQRESQEAREFLLTHFVRRGLNPKNVLMVVSNAGPGILVAKGVCSVKWVNCRPNALRQNGR